MSELAVEYVSIVPSFKGGASAIRKGLSGSAVTNAARQSGRGVGAALMTGAKRVAVASAVGVGVAVGASLMGGFRSAVSQQKSQAALKGLYSSGKDAQKIMTDLRKVSKNSSIDYSTYTKTAESLAYMGVTAKDSAPMLKNMGQMIVGAGGGSEQMSRASDAMLNMVNSGKVYAADLNQLSNTGVPVFSSLATKFFGKSTAATIAKTREMVSAGKVSITDVQDVIKTVTGDTAKAQIRSAKEVEKTWGPTWLRVKDSFITAVGANMIPILDKLAPLLQKIGDKFTAWVENADFTPLVNGIKGIVAWFGQLDFSSWSAFTKSLSSGGAGGMLDSIGKSIKTLGPAFMQFVRSVGAAGPALATLAGAGLGVVTSALKFLAKHVDTIIKFMPLIVGGFIAWSVASRAIANATLTLRAAELAAMPALLAMNIIRNNSARLEARVALAKGTNTAATTVNTGAENVNLLTRLRGVATMVAHKTAMVASTVATKAAAVGQRMLNLAMRMNPIGLIITGIIALVAGLIWFFTQTKVGKKVITAVWSAIKVAIGATVNWFKNVVIPWFASAIKNIGIWFRAMGAVIGIVWRGIKTAIGAVWLWVKTYVFIPIGNFVTKTIPAAFRAFVNFIRSSMNGWKFILSTAWEFVKKWVFTPIKNFVTKTIPDAFRLFVSYIKSRMTNFRNNLSSIWRWVKEHVFNPMRNFITETVPNAFEKGVDSIKVFWDKLKKIASKPMKFVIDTVYNKGLVKLWNPIAGFIGKDDWKLKKIDVSKFATGGRVSGPGTSTSDSIPARLSNNEHVLSAKDVKNLGGHGSVYALRNAAAKGWTPGLATGGTLSDAARWLQSKGARITEFGAWGQRVGRHSNGSLHYTNRAFDANYGPGGQNATEMAFFDRVIGKFHELFPGVRTIWRAAGHYNHFHADTGNGANIGKGGGSGGGGGWIPGLDSLVSGLKDKLNGMGGQGRIKDGMVAMGGKLIDGMADKARSVFDVFGGGGGGGGNVPAGDVVAAVRSVAKNFGWDSGQQWKSLRWLIDKESSWDPNAANPNSSARGLFQKMTSIHGALEDTAEGQTRWGLNYIKGRYNDPIGAQAWHRSHNWYANGTSSAAPGWAWVGEQGPELMKLRGGEQIKSNRASNRLVDSHNTGEKVVMNVNFNGRTDDPNEVVSKLQFEMNRFFAGGKYV